jgi:hypothetical protein
MRSRKVCRALAAEELTDEELDRSMWDRSGPIAEGWSRAMKAKFHDAHRPPTEAQLRDLLTKEAPELAKFLKEG